MAINVMSEDGDEKLPKHLVLRILFISISMLTGFTIFEMVKELLATDLTLWQSHCITILFSTIMATFIAWWVQRNQFRLTQQVIGELENRVKAEEALHNLAIELSLAEERERRRIAGELHDQVGQNLLLAKMRLNSFTTILTDWKQEALCSEVKRLIEQSVEDIRSLTFQLSPPILNTVGLTAAIGWLAAQLEKDYGLTVELLDDQEEKPLREEMRVTIFQSVRELLINIAKHARTGSARVVINRKGDEVSICVEDEGVGFDLAEAQLKPATAGGFGLYNVRQRIEYLGGRLAVESAPGSGTRTMIIAPLAA